MARLFRSLQRRVLFLAVLACRCATTTGRSERQPTLADPPETVNFTIRPERPLRVHGAALVLAAALTAGERWSMKDIQWIALLWSSPTLMVLLACSVISVVFIFERGIYYLLNLPDTDKFMRSLQPMVQRKDIASALAYCERHRGPMARVVHATVEHSKESLESLTSLLSSLIKKEEVQLERFLGILGTLGNTSPFIGLLGTVIGIIKAFQSLSQAGSGGPNVVAAGIAEALVATAAGLVVAIPAVIFYNYYVSRVRQTITDIEASVEQVLFFIKK